MIKSRFIIDYQFLIYDSNFSTHCYKKTDLFFRKMNLQEIIVFFFNLMKIDDQHDLTYVFISIQSVKQRYINCILWWYLKFTEYKFVSNSKNTFAMIFSTSNREYAIVEWTREGIIDMVTFTILIFDKYWRLKCIEF